MFVTQSSRFFWTSFFAFAIFCSVCRFGLTDEPKVQAWGDLKGRFVFEGEVPERREIRTVGPEGRWLKNNGHPPIFDESLLVNPKDQGIANVCLWLYRKRGDALPPIHPAAFFGEEPEPMKDDLRRRPKAAVIETRGLRIVPHVAMVQTGQKLTIFSNDPFGHNPIIHTPINPGFSRAIPLANKQVIVYRKPERLPCKIGCAIHPWESGLVMVQDHPYMAVTDKQGRFEIKNLPTGEWTFQTWHEKAGYISNARQDGEALPWKRGRLIATIYADKTTDLGEVIVTAEAFGK